jgi:hypothetical protein
MRAPGRGRGLPALATFVKSRTPEQLCHQRLRPARSLSGPAALSRGALMSTLRSAQPVPLVWRRQSRCWVPRLTPSPVRRPAPRAPPAGGAAPQRSPPAANTAENRARRPPPSHWCSTSSGESFPRRPAPASRRQSQHRGTLLPPCIAKKPAPHAWPQQPPPCSPPQPPSKGSPVRPRAGPHPRSGDAGDNRIQLTQLKTGRREGARPSRHAPPNPGRPARCGHAGWRSLGGVVDRRRGPAGQSHHGQRRRGGCRGRS